MIAVFKDVHEIIVVGLNADGSVIDLDGTLFGPESGRDIDEFERYDVDISGGQTVHLYPKTKISVK